MLPTFEELLAPYPTEKVLGAFKEHLKTKPTMPTPSEILAILNWDPLPKSAESKAFDRKVAQQKEEFERYHQLSPEKKAEHDKLMAEIKEKAAPETKLTKGPGKLNYKHWDSMPDEAQQACRQGFIESHKRLKGQPDHD